MAFIGTLPFFLGGGVIIRLGEFYALSSPKTLHNSVPIKVNRT